MNNDTRDDELRALLDRATSRIDPDPEARLERVRRSGSTRRAVKWTAIGAALALFIGAMGWAAVELKGRGPALLGGRGGPVSLDEGEWVKYHQPGQNWTVRFPPQWYLQPFEVSCISWGGEGAIVTNVAHAFRQVKGSNFCTSEWDMRALPSNLVVVEVGRFGGGPYIPPGCCGHTIPPDTPLPLSLDSAKPSYGEETYGAPQPHFAIPVVAQGNEYEVMVWFGHDASAQDREIARRIVASIYFGKQASDFPDSGPSPSSSSVPPPVQQGTLTLTPDHGPVGTLVEVKGTGFIGPMYQGEIPYLFALIRDLNGCEIEAFGENPSYNVDQAGNLSGSFVVPRRSGPCLSSHQTTHAVVPGIYSFTFDCHACVLSEFRVTKE